MVNIFERSSDLIMNNCLALIKRTWSKLNTVYWTFTVLKFTVELGWHAFYNQLLFLSNNENSCGESDARANRF